MPMLREETVEAYEARLKKAYYEPEPTHWREMTEAQRLAFEQQHSLNGHSPIYSPPPIPAERRQRTVDPKAIPGGHALDWSREDADRWAAANGITCLIKRHSY